MPETQNAFCSILKDIQSVYYELLMLIIFFNYLNNWNNFQAVTPQKYGDGYLYDMPQVHFNSDTPLQIQYDVPLNTSSVPGMLIHSQDVTLKK